MQHLREQLLQAPSVQSAHVLNCVSNFLPAGSRKAHSGKSSFPYSRESNYAQRTQAGIVHGIPQSRDDFQGVGTRSARRDQHLEFWRSFLNFTNPVLALPSRISDVLSREAENMMGDARRSV